MLKPLVTAGMFVGAVGVLLAPGVAHACSCADGVRATSPADGATNVPTNAEIKLLVFGFVRPEDFTLEGNGRELPFTTSIVGELSTQVVRLRPTEVLSPSTRYRLSGPDLMQPIVFSTGEGPDLEPPAAPVLLGREYVEEGTSPFGPVSSCGPTVGYEIELAPGVDDNAPADDVWFLVYTGTNTGDVDLENPKAVLRSGGDFLGNAACNDSLQVEAGESLAIALRAVDRAGNVSDGATAETLSSCGCAAGAGGPGAVVWLVGSILWRARRRGFCARA